MKNLAKLSADIVRCEIAKEALSKCLPEMGSDALACSALVRAQLLQIPKAHKNCQPPTDAGWGEKWLVPEPWNGDIRRAKLLFVGQNPGADFDEDYMTLLEAAKLEDGGILEYFESRFDRFSPKPGSLDGGGSEGVKVPLKKVHPATKAGAGPVFSSPNKFLVAAADLASIIFGRNVIAGKDYAITEAVRCKTTKIEGIDQASRVCTRRYMSDTLGLSAAEVIVCMGEVAKRSVEYMCQDKTPLEWHIEVDGSRANKLSSAGLEVRNELCCLRAGVETRRLVLCIGHSAAWGNAFHIQKEKLKNSKVLRLMADKLHVNESI